MESRDIKKIQSTSEILVEGVNFYTCKQTAYNGVVWTSYNASIGNSHFSCLSLEQLQDCISNYVFETAESRLLMGRGIAEFGTSA